MYFKEILGQVAENQARRTQSRRRSLCGDALKKVVPTPRADGRSDGVALKNDVWPEAKRRLAGKTYLSLSKHRLEKMHREIREAKGRSKFLPLVERPGQGDLVGKFQLGPHGHTLGQAGDPDPQGL